MESESNAHDAGPSCSYQASPRRIFLSHSGAQKGFVEWLYKRLSIQYTADCVFFDKDMTKGVNFVKEIFQAVEECELAIVVMSSDYFQSKWPMIELEAIVETQKSRKQPKNDSGQSKITPKELHIVPLYYKLTVTDFKDKEERNKWREAWKEIIKKDEDCEQRHFDGETEARWLELLKTFSPDLHGCVIHGRSEEEYIEDIVQEVCKLVAPNIPRNTTGLQGFKRYTAEFEKLKCLDPKKPVSFFGMYGICGTGKTAMSLLFCDQMSEEFLGKVCHVELDTDPQMMYRSRLLESLCIWSTGKPTTQPGVKGEYKLLEQELPKHKLFLVLDNVQTSDTSGSLEFVEFCLNFRKFKAGSVVLITSSCSHETLLHTFPNITWTEVFPVPTLQKEEAACLLAKSAGCELPDLSDEERMYVSKFVERCYLGFKKNDRQYHPLALKFLGSYARRSGRKAWVNWYGICQLGEQEVFSKLRERVNKLLGQLSTSVNLTMYFDIILTLPRGDTRVSSRILHTQEDFCEWYTFAFPKAIGITESIEEMKRQALLVIEDCRNYWGMDNHSGHKFLVHDLYREVVTLNCNIRADVESYHKSRINVQNDAELSTLCKHSDANIMRVVRCSDITKLDLQGLNGLRSLEIRHCPNLREVRNYGENLYCLLWEGCAVKFPSLIGMTKLQLLIIQGDDSNSPSMRRLSKLPGCFPLWKNSMVKKERSNYLKDCTLLRVLHLSSLQDLLEFPDLGHLKHLVKLEVADCRKVRSLGGLTNLARLEHLFLSNLDSLEELPGLGGLIALKDLRITNCPKLCEIPALENLTNLIHLCLDTLPIEQIPDNEHLVKRHLGCRHSNLKASRI